MVRKVTLHRALIWLTGQRSGPFLLSANFSVKEGQPEGELTHCVDALRCVAPLHGLDGCGQNLDPSKTN